jgi:cell wall-associated NlpC family hydrolase
MKIGQTHPDFPEVWTSEIAALARAHALDVWPNEAAGIIENGEYVRLDNVAENPETEVALSDADMLRVTGADLFFHSHPESLACPSTQDMTYQQQLEIPFVIMATQTMDTFCFGDQCPRSPLLNRGFRHGVHDCYTLIRDWYMTEHGIELWNKPRDWDWWSRNENLYVENFADAGFREINASEKPLPGDLYLFNFNHPVPMHGSIVIDKDLLLHHPSSFRAVDHTRLSVMVPRQRYMHLVTLRLRHRDVA